MPYIKCSTALLPLIHLRRRGRRLWSPSWTAGKEVMVPLLDGGEGGYGLPPGRPCKRRPYCVPTGIEPTARN